MACFRPLNAWQKAKGQQPQFTPAKIKLQLSCQQCLGCRLERSRQWATRCIHEASLHQENSFVTLTYDEENVPSGGTLVKSHFQKFMKRLRWHTKKKIRYYMCGEYGGELGRPHYHALLFGHDFVDKKVWTEREGVVCYTSDQLESLWPAGFSTVGDITWETAAYVARYILKKQTGQAADEHYQRIDIETGEIRNIEPEYSTMSLKPAIGREWFETYRGDCFPKDFITHNGRKFRVPRYYDTLLQDNELEEIKARRKEQATQWLANNTTTRLRTRERVAQARTKNLTRTLQ